MIEYNVLWVDDKPFPDFEKRCKKHGINLERVPDSDAGKKRLNDDINHWDFVLLDGRGTKKGEVENTRGAKDMLKELKKLELVRRIPCCIFSAYAEETDIEAIKEFYEDICVKSKIEDEDLTHPFEELINYIISEAQKLDERQVISLFSDVFEAADCLELPQERKDNLVDYLKSLTIAKYRSQCPDGNNLRKVIEFICKRLYDVYQLIPKECFKADGRINLTDSIEYLCGKKTPNVNGVKTIFGAFDTEGPILCDILGDIVAKALNYTQVDSHDASEVNDPDFFDVNARTRAFREQVPSPLYLYSATLAVCDFIKYINKYVQAHPDSAVNKKRTVVLKDLFDSVHTRIANGKRMEEGTATIHIDDNGLAYCCGHIRLGTKRNSAPEDTLEEGKQIIITDLTRNKGYDEDGYKYFTTSYSSVR